MSEKRRFKKDADYFLSRMDEDILRSLNTKQIWEIKKAINYAIGRPSRKLVDIRFTIPLILSRYFFVLFIGRDFRRGKRYYDLPGPVRTANAVFGAFLLVCLISFAIVAFLAVLYFIKCAFGIDIFPNIHLNDVLHMFF